MMTPSIRLEQRTGPHTFEDFCRIIREDQKADLINGVIYMASPENTDANELFGWLFTVMNLFVRRKKLGQISGSRVAFRLAEKHGPEPDIAFVRTENLDRVKRGGVEGPADLAIEIVSPDSIERDYYLKRELYEEYRIPEYWIIDEMDQKVTQLRLTQGKYREVRAKKGEYQSNVMSGFWLRPEWLWLGPRPDEIETLGQILAPKPRR
jgi:Uma2 family endonuclease